MTTPKNPLRVFFGDPGRLPYTAYSLYSTAELRGFAAPEGLGFPLVVCFANKDAIFNFPIKEELTLTLQDLLEESVDEKYYLSEKIIPFVHRRRDRKLHVKKRI